MLMIFNSKLSFSWKLNQPFYLKCFSGYSNSKSFFGFNLKGVSASNKHDTFASHNSYDLKTLASSSFPFLISNPFDFIALDSLGFSLLKRPSKKISFDFKSLVERVYSASDFSSLKFDLSADWAVSSSRYKSFEKRFKDVVGTFKNNLQKTFSNKKGLKILSFDLSESNLSIESLNQKLYKKADLHFNVLVQYFFKYFRKERVIFNLIGKENSKKEKSLNLKFKVPVSSDSFSNWSSNFFYFEKDKVKVDSKFYSCKVTHKSSFDFSNDSSNWKELDPVFKDVSFDKTFSFFESDYLNDFFKILNEQLLNLYEKNISDKLKLVFIMDLDINKKLPFSLNDMFEFESKNFKIVGVEGVQVSGASFKVTLDCLECFSECRLDSLENNNPFYKFNWDEKTENDSLVWSDVCDPENKTLGFNLFSPDKVNSYSFCEVSYGVS